MLEEDTLEIYVDASVIDGRACLTGIIKEITSSGEENLRELFSKDIYQAKSTEAEILACVSALEEADIQGEVQGKRKIVVYSDSKAVVDGYRNMAYWVSRGVIPSGVDLRTDNREWKLLSKQRGLYIQKYNIRPDIEKVKAHDSNQYNNLVDMMAKSRAKQPGYLYPKPTSVLSYPKKNKIPKRKEQPIKMLKAYDQNILIRVRDCEYQAKKIWVCNYEFFEKQTSSWAYSEHKAYSQDALENGSIYTAKVSKIKNSPWILNPEKRYK